MIVEENHEKGWIQLEKQDYVQVVLKLEATFDICTGLLEREDCRIYISEIAKLIDRVKLVH